MDISEDRVVLDNTNTHTHSHTTITDNRHPLHSVLERERETFTPIANYIYY